MKNKRISLDWLPGARGDFISSCLYVLYNYEPNMNVSDIYEFGKNGKAYFKKNIANESIRTPYTIFQNLSTPISNWEYHFGLRKLIDNSFDSDLHYEKLISTCFKNITTSDNVDILGSHNAFTEFTSRCNDVSTYFSLLKNTLGVDITLVIDVKNIKGFIECIVSHKLKDTRETVDELIDNKEWFSTMVLHNIHKMSQMYGKCDGMIDYDAVMNMDHYQFCNHISDVVGIETTTNDAFEYMYETYKNNNKEIEDDLNKVVEEYLKYLTEKSDVFHYCMKKVMSDKVYSLGIRV